MTLYWSRQVFTDFDSGQETIILKHKEVGGQELPDERQQEPLALISFITMTTIVEYLHTGVLKVSLIQTLYNPHSFCHSVTGLALVCELRNKRETNDLDTQ